MIIPLYLALVLCLAVGCQDNDSCSNMDINCSKMDTKS